MAGFAQEHCRKLITPDLEQIDKVPEHYRDWHHGVQDAIDADVLKRRDTLEELEADLGFAAGRADQARWRSGTSAANAARMILCIPCRPNGCTPS